MIGVKKKEDVFYTLFRESAEKIVMAGEAFLDLVTNYTDVEAKVARMKAIETECDQQTHKILKTLNACFITPLDREDIYYLSKNMDEIVDTIEEVANRFLVFDVKIMRPEAIALSQLIMQSIRELEVLFRYISELKTNKIVMEQVIEVNRLENEGDIVYRGALTKLFREEKDPNELIKWKHLYEQLEASLDACENVANIVEGAVMKYA